MAELQLKSIRKTYPRGNKRVLDGFDLQVGAGECVALVGAAGAGKSTLLRIAVGLEPADAGDVFVDGRNASRLSPADRRIALLHPRPVIYPHLPVYGNLRLGLQLRKIDRLEADRRVRASARRLNMTDLLDRPLRVLSPEERLRVALGRVLVREPLVLLLDDPLAAVEPSARAAARAELAALIPRLGLTTLVALRERDDALALGARVVEMAI